MPLLLIDLDDTLLDRASAFTMWGARFLRDIGAPPDDLDWLVSVDADGLTSRWDLADAIRDRYRLAVRAIDLVEELDEGVLSHIRLDPMVACALRIAGDARWVPVIVCNGTTRQMEAKIRRTGLDRHVLDWVISEEAEVSKPNPRIFEIAARRARMRLDGAWLMGDSPETDIAGAAGMGLRSVWVNRGRQWTERRYAPTRIADGPIAALAAVMEGGRALASVR